MSYTREIIRKVTVDINGKEKQVEALYEALCSMFGSKTCEWDMEYNLTTDDYAYTIKAKETGVETVYPGCYTLSNGDPGYPDEYADDLGLYEESVTDFIDEFAESRNYEFEYFVNSVDDYN